MFSQKDIATIYSEAYSDFSKKHKIKCSLKFIKEEDFFYLSKKSKLIEENLIEGIPILVGALVKHSFKNDTIYMNVDIVNQITSDKYFVKSLIIHEFYHVLLKNKIQSDSLSEEAQSEIRAKETMAREFPQLSKNIV